MKISKASHPQIQQHTPTLSIRVKAGLFAGSLLAGLIVATQVFAWRVHFSSALGPSWQHLLSALENHRLAVAVGSRNPERDHAGLGRRRLDRRIWVAANLAAANGGPSLRPGDG